MSAQALARLAFFIMSKFFTSTLKLPADNFEPGDELKVKQRWIVQDEDLQKCTYHMTNTGISYSGILDLRDLKARYL